MSPSLRASADYAVIGEGEVAMPALLAAIESGSPLADIPGLCFLQDGKPVGSALIGQNFGDPRHFWGRPSATGDKPYNPLASGGSNAGPTNPALPDTRSGNGPPTACGQK